jgi:uncharacterized membrane protein
MRIRLSSARRISGVSTHRTACARHAMTAHPGGPPDARSSRRAEETIDIANPSESPPNVPFWKRHPRLIIAAIVSIACYLLMSSWVPPGTDFLVAFDVGTIVYLAAIWTMMIRTEPSMIRQRAKIEDEGRIAVLISFLGVASAVLIAIAFELHGVKELSPAAAGLRLLLAAVTILMSWFFTNTFFAEHYAHEYYIDDECDTLEPARGLMFPGQDMPDYWDFLYFSFVLGMTFQVSDVQIYSHRLRRIALAHGILAFFFNVFILALIINIVAGMI